MAENKVSAQELASGLFLFCCTRGHALEPGARGETDERLRGNSKNASAHAPLVAALLEAERGGRVGRRHDDKGGAT